MIAFDIFCGYFPSFHISPQFPFKEAWVTYKMHCVSLYVIIWNHCAKFSFKFWLIFLISIIILLIYSPVSISVWLSAIQGKVCFFSIQSNRILNRFSIHEWSSHSMLDHVIWLGLHVSLYKFLWGQPTVCISSVILVIVMKISRKGTAKKSLWGEHYKLCKHCCVEKQSNRLLFFLSNFF